MQGSKQQHFSQNPPGPPLTGQGGQNENPFSSLFGGHFQNVNFQPSETCPRNFIIFDQTDNRSQIMYHPGLAPPKQCYPAGLNNGSSPWLLQDNLKSNEVLFSKQEISSSSIIKKEDSDDIDALLSFEEEEYEDEEVSTGRSCNYDSDSADDSCSSKPRKRSKLAISSSYRSSGSGKSKRCGERKREKMREMVKTLRGMMPGSRNRKLNSVDVVDEAVRHLKSLKVELQHKFGAGNLNK